MPSTPPALSEAHSPLPPSICSLPPPCPIPLSVHRSPHPSPLQQVQSEPYALPTNLPFALLADLPSRRRNLLTSFLIYYGLGIVPSIDENDWFSNLFFPEEGLFQG